MKQVIKRKAARQIRTEKTDVSVSVGPKDSPVSRKTTHRSIGNLPEHPAFITVEGGTTRNIGNYESVRLGITVTRPCGNTDEDINSAYDITSDLVSSLIDREYERIMNERSN